jgi:hypothetical protein
MHRHEENVSSLGAVRRFHSKTDIIGSLLRIGLRLLGSSGSAGPASPVIPYEYTEIEYAALPVTPNTLYRKHFRAAITPLLCSIVNSRSRAQG